MRAAVLAALVAAVALTSCERRPERIRIGIGMAANTRLAVELAAREINAQGGVGGVPLELSGLDAAELASPFDPAEVLAMARRFVDTPDLLAVVGHSDSATTISAAPSYNRAGLPQIVTIATNPGITAIGDWTYRLCLSDAEQGPALAEYVVNDWNKRRIVVMFVNDEYGRGLAQRFEARAKELGAEIAASVMHRNALEADDRQMIQFAIAEMKAAPPDLVALFQRTEAAAWTLAELRDSGIDADILGGDNLAQAPVLALDLSLIARLRVSQFYSPPAGPGRAAEFARHYRAVTGAEPDYSQAFAYDAIYLIRDAVRDGGYSRSGVKAALDRMIRRRTPVQGAGGTFTLAPDHDAIRELFVAEVRDRGFTIIKSLPVR